MSKKRKHVTLSLEDKCTILQRLEKGESSTNLSNEFNVGKSTISDIKKNKEKILSFVSICEQGPNKRHTLKSSNYPRLDAAVYEWFLQERSRQTPISGLMLKEKAKFFQAKIYPKATDFKASDSWLNKFKKRHGIRFLCTPEENHSSDTTDIKPFELNFLSKIQELGLVPEQVYNANESDLAWKVLPDITFVDDDERRKLPQERITFMVCANATGTHKLRMMVIGKSQKPRAFRDCPLPVLYKGQSKGWMDVALFKEWFHEEFVPSVETHLKSINLEHRALLLIDNCPGHPDENELVSNDGCIKAMFLPSNCPTSIQLMEQNVIQTIKLQYRKTLLSHVIAQERDIKLALKILNLKDVVLFLTTAWDFIQPKLIRASWNKLLGKENDQEEVMDVIDGTSRSMIVDMVKKIKAEADMDQEGIAEWIEEREENHVFIKTDEEILEGALKEHDDGKEDESAQALPTTSVTHEDAVSHFNHCLTWAMENDMSWKQIIILQQLRDAALAKLLKKSNQTKITDFFQKK